MSWRGPSIVTSATDDRQHLRFVNGLESVDGQWYPFIIDQDGYTIAHHNPALIRRDPSERVDSTGYFYGDDVLAATDEGPLGQLRVP